MLIRLYAIGMCGDGQGGIALESHGHPPVIQTDMFAQKLRITCSGEPVPLRWLDSFAMRNFTNKVAFDDTLPVTDGLLEAGFRVPVAELTAAMEEWFRRKGWLGAGERLCVVAEPAAPTTQPTRGHAAS